MLELPGLSQLVFLANLGLVIPATYYLSDGLLDQIKKQNSEYTEKWNGYILFKLKYSLTISFFVLTVTLLFFLIQCLAYNEFGLDEKLDPVFLMIYIIIIFSGMITALFNIIKLSRRIGKEHNPFSHQPWCEKNFMYFTLIIAFMSLAQTMITKVILLLSLVDWAAPAVIKFLGKLAPAMTPKDTQIKSSYERTISELTSASFWHKLNFFFLTTSALVLLILYQFHCSPYPPSNSAFPKTETISGLYMIYMLAYLLIGKGKHIFVQSVLWILATIIILYGTPVLFPSWYLPSIDPPGISAIDAIEKISGIWTSVVFVFVIHMGICIVFISLYYSTELKEFLIRNKYNSVLHFNKFLFLRLFLMEYFYYVLFGFFFLIIFGSEFYSIIRTISRVAKPDMIVKLELIIFLLPVFIYHILNKTSKRNTIDDIREDVVKFGEEGTVESLVENIRLLKFFRSWNNNCTKLQQNTFLFILTGFFGLFLAACMFVPRLFDHEQVKVSWIHKIKSNELPKYSLLRDYANMVIFNSKDSLFCAEQETGTLKWKLPLKIKQAEKLDENSLILMTEDELFALTLDSCKRIWTADISGMEISNDTNTTLSKLGLFSVLRRRNEINIFDNSSGESIFSSGISYSVEPVEYGGSLFLVSNEDVLQKIDPKGDVLDINNFQDSVMKMHSFKDILAIMTNDKLMVYNFHGELQWMKSIPAKGMAYNIIEAGSCICINSQDTIKGYRKKDGSEIWSLSGCNFKNIGIDFLNNKKSSFAPDSSCFFVSKNRDLMLIDAQNGKSIQTFKNIFYDNWPTTTLAYQCSGDTIAMLGAKNISLYSIKTGKRICTHDYLNAIYNIDPSFFHEDPTRVRFCSLLKNDNMFFLNQYGLISMKLKD
ncbi:MAG TPA: hypothetical protein VK155_02795 [Bacteroidales bacterium]|nr:hypothetical protein [Bacteroidales bacterium]